MEECDNIAQSGGVCIGHGAMKKRCSLEGCEKQAQKRGVCYKHLGSGSGENYSSEDEDEDDEEAVLLGTGEGLCLPYIGCIGHNDENEDKDEEAEPQKKRAKTEYQIPARLDTPQIQLPEIADPVDDTATLQQVFVI